MRAIPTVLLVVVMAGAAFGQTGADDSPPADVRILSFKWIDKSQVRLVQERNDPGPAEVRRVNQFELEMKLANAGSRDVRHISWDYSSIDPSTQAEITNYHFYSLIKIRAHKETTLTTPFHLLPAGVVLTDGSRSERVVLNCVVFSDKSVWRRSSYDGSCWLTRPPRMH